MSRISRDHMFMEIAHIVAKRGTCDRAQVGAVLVSNGRIVSMGYNGSLPGEPHCDDVGHRLVDGHCTRTLHAEVNCLDFAYNYLVNRSNKDDSVINVTMYVTHLPCDNCIKHIVEANQRKHPYLKVTRIVFGKLYPSSMLASELIDKSTILRDGGVESLEQFEV